MTHIEQAVMFVKNGGYCHGTCLACNDCMFAKPVELVCTPEVQGRDRVPYRVKKSKEYLLEHYEDSFASLL